jgi:hypothetical protein
MRPTSSAKRQGESLGRGAICYNAGGELGRHERCAYVDNVAY